MTLILPELICRHWFYDDYLRPLNPALPPLSQKHFSKVIIASSPLYSHLVDEDGLPINYDLTWDRYTTYKRMVPTCGVVLINAERTKVSHIVHIPSDVRHCWSDISDPSHGVGLEERLMKEKRKLLVQYERYAIFVSVIGDIDSLARRRDRLRLFAHH